MPPALYNRATKTLYSSKDEMDKARKMRDNIAQKIRYWRKKYGYDLSKNDYTEFNRHVQVIKKIYHIHDFVCQFDKSKIGPENLDLYVQHAAAIDAALPIREYLRTLTKIEDKAHSGTLKKLKLPLKRNGKIIVEF